MSQFVIPICGCSMIVPGSNFQSSARRRTATMRLSLTIGSAVLQTVGVLFWLFFGCFFGCQRMRCGIYDLRPSACRVFAVGAGSCRDQRNA